MKDTFLLSQAYHSFVERNLGGLSFRVFGRLMVAFTHYNTNKGVYHN